MSLLSVSSPKRKHDDNSKVTFMSASPQALFCCFFFVVVVVVLALGPVKNVPLQATLLGLVLQLPEITTKSSGKEIDCSLAL